MGVWWVVLVTLGKPLLAGSLLEGEMLGRPPVALCESALAPTSSVYWEELVPYRLPTVAGPVGVGVPLKGTPGEPPAPLG